MTGIEIVLLLSGGLIFTLSFLLPSSSNDESTDSEITTQGSEKLNRTLDRMMDAKETEIRHRVREIADDEAVEAGNSTKRNLERITNEKIMAVDEYSKTVLDAIEKNHQEVIFLYDMLNNKSVDLKNTIRKAEQTKKEVEAYGLEALNEKLEFNEEEVLNNNAELFKKLAKLEEIEIAEYNETNKPKGCKDTAIPGKPLIVRA